MDFIELIVTPDIEQAPWDQSRITDDGALTNIGLLRHGTVNGKAVVGLLVTMPDGHQVVAQTTWALFRAAYAALAASPIVAEEVIDP